MTRQGLLIEMIMALGVTPEHITFILLSVAVATLGGGVHIFNARTDLSRFPEDASEPKSRDHAFAIVAWILARMALSVATGLVLGMYLAPTAGTGEEALRLLALVAIAGYSAPKLWAQQGKALEGLIIGKEQNTGK